MDNEQVYTSPVMTQDTEAEHVRLNIIGAKELKLVVDSMGTNAHDHSDWANARFLPRGEGDFEQIEVTGIPEQIQLKEGSTYTLNLETDPADVSIAYGVASTDGALSIQNNQITGEQAGHSEMLVSLTKEGFESQDRKSVV